jgi:uncharacterized protein YndB with AHSA1/START domain
VSDTDLSVAHGTVAVERFIEASPQRIWQVIGTAEGMQQWLGLHLYQPKLGGRVLLDTSGANEAQRIIVFGRITSFEPEQQVVFTWAQLTSDRKVWPVDTEVELKLEAGAGGTLTRFTHRGFDRLDHALAQSAYSIYHHCWVECGYLSRLDELSHGEA